MPLGRAKCPGISEMPGAWHPRNFAQSIKENEGRRFCTLFCSPISRVFVPRSTSDMSAPTSSLKRASGPVVGERCERCHDKEKRGGPCMCAWRCGECNLENDCTACGFDFVRRNDALIADLRRRIDDLEAAHGSAKNKKRRVAASASGAFESLRQRCAGGWLYYFETSNEFRTEHALIACDELTDDELRVAAERPVRCNEDQGVSEADLAIIDSLQSKLSEAEIKDFSAPRDLQGKRIVLVLNYMIVL